MNKLKTQNFNNLLNYQHFLKNNSLKRKKYKLKNILFENQLVYKNHNLNLNIIELYNSENIQIPTTVLDFKDTYTIESFHKNQLLFNYNLNYNILHNYNNLMVNYKKKNNNNTIQGRIVTGDYKKAIIAVLGRTVIIKIFYLNRSINKKRKIYVNKFYARKYKKKNKSKYEQKKILNEQVTKLFISYTLRYLNFKIEKTKKKFIFSRISYVDDLYAWFRLKKLKKQMLLEKKIRLEKKKILLERKKKKSNFSRNQYVKKTKK
jgi:hypothetical protein